MHEQFMRLALAQAAQSGSDVPVGAVIVRDGQVIASAHNEREAQDSPLAHAEMLAMERACRALHTRRLSGCTLYVTLEPCPMCAGAMVMAQLDGCVFGAYGVLENECARLLRAFFEKRRGKNAPSL